MGEKAKFCIMTRTIMKLRHCRRALRKKQRFDWPMCRMRLGIRVVIGESGLRGILLSKVDGGGCGALEASRGLVMRGKDQWALLVPYTKDDSYRWSAALSAGDRPAKHVAWILFEGCDGILGPLDLACSSACHMASGVFLRHR